MSGRGRSPIREGVNFLVVEDEFLVADLIAGTLSRLGVFSIEIAGNLDMARSLIDEREFDAAAVDINLRGEIAYGLAEEIQRRKIPFFFMSGYAIGDSFA